MQRIAIVGNAGAGKSVLARRLGEILGIEVVHLDRHFWRPGWTETPREEWHAWQRERVRGERWIIDGNYGGSMDIRLQAADTVIFLDMPRLVCVYRVVRRELAGQRPDLPDGCSNAGLLGLPRQLDFIRYVWNYNRRSRESVLERLRALPPEVRVVRLRSRHDVRRYLDTLQLSAR